MALRRVESTFGYRVYEEAVMNETEKKNKSIESCRENFVYRVENGSSRHDVDCDDWPESFGAMSALYREQYHGGM